MARQQSSHALSSPTWRPRATSLRAAGRCHLLSLSLSAPPPPLFFPGAALRSAPPASELPPTPITTRGGPRGSPAQAGPTCPGGPWRAPYFQPGAAPGRVPEPGPHISATGGCDLPGARGSAFKMLVSAPAPWLPGPLDARSPGCSVQRGHEGARERARLPRLPAPSARGAGTDSATFPPRRPGEATDSAPTDGVPTRRRGPHSPSPALRPRPARPSGQWAPGPCAVAPPPRRGPAPAGELAAREKFVQRRLGGHRGARDAAAREEEDARPQGSASGSEDPTPPPGSQRRPQRQPPAPVAARVPGTAEEGGRAGPGAPCHLRAAAHRGPSSAQGLRQAPSIREGTTPQSRLHRPNPPALPAPRSLKAAHPDPSSRPWAAAGDPALSGERGSGSPSRGARRRTGLEACPARLRLDSGHLRGPHR